jgi:hypothetical protein
MADEQNPQGTEYERDTYSRDPSVPARRPMFHDSTQGLLQRQQELGEREQGVLAARSREMAAPIREAQRAAAVPIPQAPKQERLPQFNPDQGRADLFAWTQAASLFGALAGAFGRKSATTALNAMAGMNKGLAEGDLQAYEMNYKTWQANSRAAAENNRQKLQEYEAILQSRKMNIDQKMSEIELVATKYQDAIAASAAAQKNFTQFAEIMQKGDQNQNSFEEKMLAIETRDSQFHEKMNTELAKNGLQRRDDGSIEIDTSPGSPMELQAQQISEYKAPPLSSTGGRGPLNRLIMARVYEISDGKYDAKRYNAMNAAGTAGARALATRSANLELIINNVAQAAPAAVAASDGIPRGSWMPVNRAIQAAQTAGSDPKLRDFAVKNIQLAELWARAMNPQGVMRVEDRNIALTQLSAAQGQEAYRAAVSAIVSAIKREKDALKETKSEVMGGEGGGAPGAAPGAAQPGAAGMSDDELKKKLGL